MRLADQDRAIKARKIRKIETNLQKMKKGIKGKNIPKELEKVASFKV
jgi:hypothetical protein